MNNYFFKYNSKKEIVIYDSNGKIISEGVSVFNAFDLMTLDIIKNVVINGNDLIIHYDYFLKLMNLDYDNLHF